MRLLRQLAFAAAAVYTLSIPVQSRVLPSSSIISRDHKCLTTTCTDLIDLSIDHLLEREHNSALKGHGSIFERAPVAPPRIKPNPKPKPDSPTVKPGDTPSRPGDPKDVPAHIGADPVDLPVGASKPGDPGEKLIGEAKDPVILKTKGEKVDAQAHKTADEYNLNDLQKKFDENYRLKKEDGDFGEDDEDIEEAMEDLGVDMDQAEYLETQVFSNAGPRAVSWAKNMPDEGIIIGESRFADRDLNPDNLKLRPSDLTFLQWKDAAGDAQVKGLRAFVGRRISSMSTVTAMQQAQRDTRQPLYEKATFERGANTPEKQSAFNLMMGTDFISSLGYSLKDNAPDKPGLWW
ncbi:MAG: hypothetical protein Q9172_001204 [Xanthocarpia lactea]